jgi:predicted transcriptional regulator
MNTIVSIVSYFGNGFIFIPSMVCGSRSLSRRTMVDVMADILRVAGHPCSKTQILYAANLSYEQAKKYCDLLVECGMLSKLEADENGGERFLTTTNGAGFLSQMSRFGSISPGESSVWEKKNAQG